MKLPREIRYLTGALVGINATTVMFVSLLAKLTLSEFIAPVIGALIMGALIVCIVRRSFAAGRTAGTNAFPWSSAAPSKAVRVTLPYLQTKTPGHAGRISRFCREGAN